MTNLGNLGMGMWALLQILNILKSGTDEDKANRVEIISLGSQALIKFLKVYLNPPADDTAAQ